MNGVWLRQGLRKHADVVVLILLVVVAAVLRFYGLKWDSLQLLHPDERQIVVVAQRVTLPASFSFATLLNAETSPLNPHFFSYGSLPIYLLRVVAALVGLVSGRSLAYDSITLVGRFVNVLFDLGIIVLVFVLGRRVFGRWVGVLGAAFVTFSVIHVQLAHFYTVDTLLVLLILATVLFAVNTVERPGWRWPLLCGIGLGLGLATKVSILPLPLVLIVALAMRWFDKGSAGGPLSRLDLL